MPNPLLQLGQEIDQEVAQRKKVPAQAGGGGGVPAQSAPSPNQPAEGVLGSAVTGVLDTALFGTLDEVSGTLSTFLPGGLSGQKTIWNSDKGLSDTLANNIAIERANLEADRKAHPWAFHGGQLAGALLVPIGAEAKGWAEFAKVGSAQGAAYGFGSGEGSSRLTGAVEGAAVGGLAGGVLGKVGETIAPRVKAVWGKLTGWVANTEAEAAGRAAVSKWNEGAVIPEGPLLGSTREGKPILAGVVKDEAGAPSKSLTEELLPAKVEQVAGDTIEPGTSVAKPSAGAKAKDPLSERDSLKALQGVVRDLSAEQKAVGDSAVDITWETAPDVAARTGEWTIGSLGAPEDAQSLLRAIVEGTGSKTTRSDADLEKAAFEAAGRIGEDPEAVLAYASEVAGKLGDVDTAVRAVRTLWSRVSQDVTDFHLMNVDWETASDALVGEAAKRIYNLTAISHQVQSVKTGLGRGLRVLQLPTAKAYLEDLSKVASEGFAEPAASREIMPLPRNRQEVADWFELWGATGGDPKRQSSLLQGILTLPTGARYLRQSMANFFTASILSAPRTVAMNVIGPGFISVVRNVERLAGAAEVSLNPFVSAEERAAARQVAKHTAKAYVQTFTEVGDAFRMALLAAERNHTLIGGGGQSMDSLATYGPLTENLINAAGGDPGMAYSLGNLINVFPRAFARLNNGLDEFSKRLAYQGEVRVNSMVEASLQGLEGEAHRDFVAAAMKNAYDAAGHATDSALLRSAERTTLTAQVGEDGTFTRQFANGLQRLRGAIPEVRYIVPVFNVPANALGETLRRTPIAAIPGVNKVLFERTAAELAGELGPVAQADAHGRILLGAAWMLGGWQLNKAGLLTGAGPQDPTDRRVWLQTHQPYSIKIGGEWVRYDKFDILGGMLSIPATVMDATIYQDQTRDPGEVVMAGVGAMAQWFKDRAALRNAASLFALGDDPTKDTGRVFSQVTGTVASGFYPAALRSITDGVTNPYIPLKRAWTDYIASVLPGNDVELVRNVLGEPIQKPINSLTEAFVPVTVVKAVGYDEDPVLDELDRLYQITGYGAGADTSAFSYGQFEDKDLKLEDGKSLYTHAMRARQEITVEGKTLRQTLADLFNSPEYASAVDGRRGGKTTSKGDLNRPFMVGEVFEKFNKAIKADLASSSPIAKEYMTAALAKQQDAAYLRDVSVEDLVKNPDLWTTKGIDKAGFEAKAGGQGGSSVAALLDALGGNQ